MSFDPRTIGQSVYEALSQLRLEQEQNQQDKKKRDERLKEQKNQAVELYTYLATWGMLRLKAEEKAISDEKEGKKQIVIAFFKCLQEISGQENLISEQGSSNIEPLKTLTELDTEAYLGLTGLGLAIAQEFSFWATAVYHDIQGEA